MAIETLHFQELMDMIKLYSAEIICGMALLLLLMLVIQLVAYRRQARLLRRLRALVAHSDTENIEQAIDRYTEAMVRLERQLKEIGSRQQQVEEELQKCVRTPRVKRFSAFSDMGSDLSFACALLDARGNGVMLSSLFGRNESRTYAKPVEKGNSSYALSDEEKEILDEIIAERAEVIGK